MQEAVAAREKIIRTSLESIYVFSHFLAPFIPLCVGKITEMLHTPLVHVSRLNQTGNLVPGTAVTKGDILFTKIVSDEEKTAQEKKEQNAREAEENQVSERCAHTHVRARAHAHMHTHKEIDVGEETDTLPYCGRAPRKLLACGTRGLSHSLPSLATCHLQVID